MTDPKDQVDEIVAEVIEIAKGYDPQNFLVAMSLISAQVILLNGVPIKNYVKSIRMALPTMLASMKAEAKRTKH